MQVQAEPRVAKRVPCSLRVGGRRYAGLVLNLSAGGLFVQTHAGPKRGTSVEVELSAPDHSQAIPLKATVVWRRIVPSSITASARGGIGLRIKRAGHGWDDLLASVLPGRAQPAAAEAPTAARGVSLATYGVRALHGNGPRTRTLRLIAGDEEAAQAEALERLGPGWRVLHVERL